jgi:putative DNA primase/helicase
MSKSKSVEKEKLNSPAEESQGETVDRESSDYPTLKLCTDLGNAKRFYEKHGHETRYCPDNGNWYVYRDGRWQYDPGGIVMGMAFEIPPDILKDAEDPRLTPDDRKKLENHAERSASRGRLKAMLDLAMWLPGISVGIEMFDRDPWLLNCRNGTLDLRTGELKEHSADDLITKMIPVEYDPDAECPTFISFIAKIMGEDEAKTAFVQRALGYALTGDISEQSMFVAYGPGANGKSTLFELFHELLAGYAMHTTTSSLLGSAGSPIRNDLARLNGARMVTAVEIGMGKKLDEALVKQLTGGDQVTARFLYNEFFEYKPEFKLFIAANHKPDIRGVDHGIWRRIHLIPFDVKISPEEIDRDLPNKLRAELPGILAWAVRGCLQWKEQGLNVPETIAYATAAYRAEMDIIADFLGDRCAEQASEKVPLGALYDAYKEWADGACQDAMGKKTFGNLMRQKGYSQTKSGGVRYWGGLKLNQDESTES